MRKIKAIIYAILGGMMCWNTFQRGHFIMTAGIAFFTLAAIAITLAAIGQRKITWDAKGITVTKFPAAPVDIRWDELEKMKVDHMGYHIQARHAKFKISRNNMPAPLLEKIRANLRTKE